MIPVAAFFGGVLFGVGLVISGMTEPANVLAFLTLGANWNPALIFVMGSAVLVGVIGFAMARRRGRPVWGDAFHAPSSSGVDRRLLSGAVLFGLGWGVAGYCPGPAIVGLFLLDERALIFMGGYVLGTVAFELWNRTAASSALPQDG